VNEPDLPLLLTAGELAALLRTSRPVIHELASHGQLPGVTRIGRRLLFRRDSILKWLKESSATPL
jgi:excisionase family DNA binding protein